MLAADQEAAGELISDRPTLQRLRSRERTVAQYGILCSPTQDPIKQAPDLCGILEPPLSDIPTHKGRRLPSLELAPI